MRLTGLTRIECMTAVILGALGRGCGAEERGLYWERRRRFRWDGSQGYGGHCSGGSNYGCPRLGLVVASTRRAWILYSAIR
jgi:hypothetical protein